MCLTQLSIKKHFFQDSKEYEDTAFIFMAEIKSSAL